MESSRRGYLGLKWKALLFLGAVLSFLNGGLFYFHYSSMDEQAELQHAAGRTRYRTELTGLLRTSSLRLQSLGEILPSVSGIREAMDAGDAAALARAFEPHWSSFNLDMEIDTVGFFDHASAPLGLWSTSPLTSGVQAQIRDHAGAAAREEHPHANIRCDRDCVQYATIPVLSRGRVVGTLVLAKQVTSVILEFQAISGVDIGLLLPLGEVDAAHPGLWGRRLAALTHRQTLLPLLNVLAEAHSPGGPGDRHWHLRSGDRHLEVSLIPLPLASHSGEPPLVVFIADVSRPTVQARRATRTGAIIAVLSLVLSLAVALVFLWRPIDRIRETVELLPLLAEHAFDQVRARLGRRVHHRFEDETDVLCRTAANLTDQLQTLKAEVDAGTRELRRHRDHLQDLVNEQTADLKAATEAAVRADQAKSEFLANMSHELRTPLHAILSFAAMGRDKIERVPGDRLLRYFSRIHESGTRLLTLLNDLLDLSKLEAGRMHIEPRRNDLQHCLDGVADELEELMSREDLRLERTPHAVDTHAWFDGGRIGQVLRNLLSNAIRFSPPGGCIRIAFDDAELPDDGGSIPGLAFQMADQGVGIPDEELETIFDKFVQSSKTRTGAGGTGLGLAICREIVQRHGGYIRAAHNPGGGALFTFTLPRMPPAIGAQHPRPTA